MHVVAVSKRAIIGQCDIKELGYIPSLQFKYTYFSACCTYIHTVFFRTLLVIRNIIAFAVYTGILDSTEERTAVRTNKQREK